MFIVDAILFQPFAGLMLPAFAGSLLAWIVLFLTLASTAAIEMINANLLFAPVRHDDDDLLVFQANFGTVTNVVQQVVRGVTFDRILGWFSTIFQHAIADLAVLQLDIICVIVEAFTNDAVFECCSAVYQQLMAIIDDPLAEQVHKGSNTMNNKVLALPMSETYLQIIPRAPTTLTLYASRDMVALQQAVENASSLADEGVYAAIDELEDMLDDMKREFEEMVMEQ